MGWGGSGRIWEDFGWIGEDLGGFERIWEDSGGFGRSWEDVGGFGRIGRVWEDLGGFGRILEEDSQTAAMPQRSPSHS